MAYIEQQNPYLDATGRPLPGKGSQARAFAKAESDRELAAMTPSDRKRAERQHQNFADHMNVAV